MTTVHLLNGSAIERLSTAELKTNKPDLLVRNDKPVVVRLANNWGIVETIHGTILVNNEGRHTDPLQPEDTVDLPLNAEWPVEVNGEWRTGIAPLGAYNCRVAELPVAPIVTSLCDMVLQIDQLFEDNWARLIATLKTAEVDTGIDETLRLARHEGVEA